MTSTFLAIPGPEAVLLDHRPLEPGTTDRPPPPLYDPTDGFEGEDQVSGGEPDDPSDYREQEAQDHDPVEFLAKEPPSGDKWDINYWLLMEDSVLREASVDSEDVKISSIREFPGPLSEKQRWCLARYVASTYPRKPGRPRKTKEAGMMEILLKAVQDYTVIRRAHGAVNTLTLGDLESVIKLALGQSEAQFCIKGCDGRTTWKAVFTELQAMEARGLHRAERRAVAFIRAVFDPDVCLCARLPAVIRYLNGADNGDMQSPSRFVALWNQHALEGKITSVTQGYSNRTTSDVLD